MGLAKSMFRNSRFDDPKGNCARAQGLVCWVAGVLALIDRNFQGFGKELFTDAGKYVIHFGSKPTEAAEQASAPCSAALPWPCHWDLRRGMKGTLSRTLASFWYQGAAAEKHMGGL